MTLPHLVFADAGKSFLALAEIDHVSTFVFMLRKLFKTFHADVVLTSFEKFFVGHWHLLMLDDSSSFTSDSVW